MRLSKTQIECACAGALVFNILLEQLCVWGILVGAATGVFFAIAIRPLGASGTKPLSRSGLLRYVLMLIGDMLLATVYQMRAALRRMPQQIAILHLHPRVAERSRVIVANSITLTPGTVTLDETAQDYVILCADPPATQEQRNLVAASFEKRLSAQEVQR